jgi:hypothetical protein
MKHKQSRLSGNQTPMKLSPHESKGSKCWKQSTPGEIQMSKSGLEQIATFSNSRKAGIAGCSLIFPSVKLIGANMLIRNALSLGLLIAATISFSFSAMAATINYENSTYVGQVSTYIINGKKVKMPRGQGTMTYNSGAVYKGLFSKGRFQGRGNIFYKSGSYCAANFEKGKMQGGADCRYSNGNKYVGNMNNGKRHGYGGMTYSSGAYYGGSWKNNLPHGSGKIRYADGDTYDGQWVNGERTGEGAYRYTSGTSYIGFWKNDKKHGPLDYYNPEKNLRLCTLYNDGEKVKAVRHSGTRASCYNKARSW